MSKTYYIISKFDFFAHINDIIGYDRTTITGHNILIGGIKKGCLAIGIKRIDHFAEITHLEFNSKCSVKSLLTKGDESINMINVSLYIAKTHFYPHIITTINLLDDSHVFNDNGQRVNLYWAYFATHGKTWYQVHFDAKILGDDETRFNISLLKLDNPIHIDLHRYMSSVIKNTKINEKDFTEQIVTNFTIALENGFTWRQLIKSLNKKIIYNCIGPNLDYLFENIIGIEIPRKWYIDLAEWDHTKIEIKKITIVNDSEISEILADTTRK
jgi:hypothetical protein